ncbi:hypothetical protein KK060_23850 [Fulvivirgaceae bacterium PWU20]|uniref:Uncharacterized protein n=2 Tax=Chryseosolibacter indicus TaxID=2782351 RepID=A0ABS5VY47_9BACT|nr:hypothetical protein [Chryseosolibacter indicus]
MMNSCKTHNIDGVFEKLVDADILKKRQRSAFKEYLDYSSRQSNSAVLASIYAVKLKEHFGKSSALGFISFDTTGITDEFKRETRQHLITLLNKLALCGIIDSTTHNLFTKKLDASTYVHEIQLLKELTMYTAYAETITPERLHNFADSLVIYGIVPDANNARLRDAINSRSITSPFNVLDYCTHGVSFDLATYSDDPAIYLSEIHEKVARIFPGLNFTDFHFRIEVDSVMSDSSYTSRNVVVSLKCNGRAYRQKSFISLDSNEGDYLGKIDEQEFYQIFNKVLVDQQSRYRLYLVKPNLSFGANYRYFGIIALQEKQTDMFRYSTSLLDISYENHDQLPTSGQIDEAITFYQQIGLLDHVTAQSMLQAKENIAMVSMNTFNDVLSQFPDVIHNFDTELANLDDPYRELLESYKAISRGVFNPTDISDNFNTDKEKTILEFELNGKTYTKTLKVDSDWIDADFFSFVKAVVEENQLPGSFYYLAGDGQYASVIFLTDEQYAKLKEKKLLVFSDDIQ